MVRRIITAAVLAALSGAAIAQDTKAGEAREALLFDSPALSSPYRENISEDEKIAGLSKFWSEVKYNFVYVDKLKELDWDRLYLEYLRRGRDTVLEAALAALKAEPKS